MSERLEKAKEMRAQRVKLAEQSRAILAKAKDEKRDPTAEERTEIDRIHGEVDALKPKIEEIEKAYDQETRQAELDKELKASTGTLAGRQDRTADSDKGSIEERAQKAVDARKRAFRAYAVAGHEVLTPEERQLLGMTTLTREDVMGENGEPVDPRLLNHIGARGIRYRLRPVPSNPDDRLVWNRDTLKWNQRANEPQSKTDGFGGYAMPDDPMRALENALLQFGGMRQARTTVLRTATGNDLPIPLSNDTTNKGAILAENTQKTGATPIAFTQMVLQGFKYTSNFVLASLEFLQDVAIDAESFIAGDLGTRIGRITNDHFTFGSNSSQPYGVQWAATLGRTATSATALSYADLITLEHSVDPAYRAAGAQWMFNDGTFAVLKQIVDGASRLIWSPGLAFRAPDTIDSYGFVINQSMSTVAAGKHSVLFGDFSKYYIRDIMDVTVFRLVERFMDYGQVGFIAFSRHDSDLADAGTHPIKYLRHPTS